MKDSNLMLNGTVLGIWKRNKSTSKLNLSQGVHLRICPCSNAKSPVLWWTVFSENTHFLHNHSEIVTLSTFREGVIHVHIRSIFKKNFLAMRIMYIFSLRISSFCLFFFVVVVCLYTTIFPQLKYLHFGSAQNIFFEVINICCV